MAGKSYIHQKKMYYEYRKQTLHISKDERRTARFCDNQKSLR